jgi:hypothetical protein
MRSMKKPTLRQLREQHQVTINDLAYASDLSSLLVWAMLTGRPIDRSDAHAIIMGFNKLRGTQYTLEDIAVSLSREVAG